MKVPGEVRRGQVLIWRPGLERSESVRVETFEGEEKVTVKVWFGRGRVILKVRDWSLTLVCNWFQWVVIGA